MTLEETHALIQEHTRSLATLRAEAIQHSYNTGANPNLANAIWLSSLQREYDFMEEYLNTQNTPDMYDDL